MSCRMLHVCINRNWRSARSALRTAAHPAVLDQAVIMRGRLGKSAGAGGAFSATRFTPAQSLGVGGAARAKARAPREF